MNPSHPLRARRLAIPAILLTVLASGALALGTAGAHDDHAAGTHDHAPPPHTLTARQVAFHDAMRKLWEDHITWTRLAIVSFAGGLPDLQATEARLLANQVDIGNAIKPYYGRAAGDRLTALLKEHILGAVALLQAAKAGDRTQTAKASAAWYANANQIAAFLHTANPHAWSRTDLRAMMKTHLDETLAEAQHRLQGDYAADVRDYDAVHRHILAMADTLSAGINAPVPTGLPLMARVPGGACRPAQPGLGPSLRRVRPSRTITSETTRMAPSRACIAGRGRPDQGLRDRHRLPSGLARLRRTGRLQAPGRSDHRRHRAVPRQPRARRRRRRRHARAGARRFGACR